MRSLLFVLAFGIAPFTYALAQNENPRPASTHARYWVFGGAVGLYTMPGESASPILSMTFTRVSERRVGLDLAAHYVSGFTSGSDGLMGEAGIVYSLPVSPNVFAFGAGASVSGGSDVEGIGGYGGVSFIVPLPANLVARGNATARWVGSVFLPSASLGIGMAFGSGSQAAIEEDAARVEDPPPPQEDAMVTEGTRVRVTYDCEDPGANCRQLDGMYGGARSSSIVLELAPGVEQEIPSASVQEVEVSLGMARKTGRGMLIGSGIGLLVGAGVGHLLCTGAYECEPGNGWWSIYVGAGAGIGVAAGMLVGGVVGHAIHVEQWQDISLDRLRVSVVPQQGGRLGLGMSIAF